MEIDLVADSTEPLSKKGIAWIDFAQVVANHVENYSVPQYGPDIDLNIDVENAKDCMKYIAKYSQRHGSARRGRLEELRDLLKIAHFAQFAFYMLKPTDKEIAALEEGRAL